MLKQSLGFAAIALAMTATGSAQDITAEPNSDSVSLEAGFTPDPSTVNVTSGGLIDVSSRIDGCSGYISDAPDALPLYIYAKSSGDTTLVINAPDGNWYCNDDGSEGVDPMVVFGPAMSGDYEIWVGSFDEGEYHDATLEISELDGQ